MATRYRSTRATLHRSSYVRHIAAKASVIWVTVVGADFAPSLNEAPD